MHLDYRPRRIQFREHVERAGWRLKIYHLLHADKQPDDALVEAALSEAFGYLPGPDDGPRHYGVGFIGAHQGESYDFVLVAYWAYQTELRFQSFMRPTSQSYRLEPVSGSELSVDVWDLRLLGFERAAWVEHALRPDQADLDGYARATLTETL